MDVKMRVMDRANAMSTVRKLSNVKFANLLVGSSPSRDICSLRSCRQRRGQGQCLGTLTT